MEGKELKKLRREELLEMLIQAKRENDELKKELQRVTEEKDQEIAILTERLEDKHIRLGEAGTMAEAALAIYKVFEQADQAAALYLDSVKALAAEQVARTGNPAQTEGEYTG